jgi:hypothetical protein
MILKQNQSTFDLSTQISGDPKAVLDLCLANGFSITEELQAGTIIKEYITDFKNILVSSEFQAKDKILATGGVKAEAIPLGIGTMIISTNFDIL